MCHILGYSRLEFYDMSLKDIINLIRQHKKMNEKQYQDANNNRNNKQKMHSESFSYGRAMD